MADKKLPTKTEETPPTSKPTDKHDENEEPEVVKFSPEEEAELVAESNAHKTEANSLFNSGAYTEALAKYSDATDACPIYLDFELAVLHSNISACHLKLQEWKNAIASATNSLKKLDNLSKQLAEEEAQADAQEKAKIQEEEEVEEEIVSAGATSAAPAPPKEEEEDPAAAARAKRKADIERIRYKALIRRARARSEEGGWSNLAGAKEDYEELAKMKNITPGDRKMVREQLRALPPRIEEAGNREKAEMMAKLKQLGNGILKPFGLSTDNFQMTQDPKTGGYSMNFKSG